MSIGFPRRACTTDIPHSFVGTSQYRRVQLIVTHFIYCGGKNVAFSFFTRFSLSNLCLPRVPSYFSSCSPPAPSLSIPTPLPHSRWRSFFLTPSRFFCRFFSSFYSAGRIFLVFRPLVPRLPSLSLSRPSLGFFPVGARPRASKSFLFRPRGGKRLRPEGIQ